jgi:hypothetical protein
MDKKIAGLLGAAAALTTISGVQAAAPQQTEAAAPSSYRELLEPVPNALASLKADDARLAAGANDAPVQLAQYHHHHHHHGYVRVIPPPRPRYRHHHHHHHHHHHNGSGIYIGIH